MRIDQKMVFESKLLAQSTKVGYGYKNKDSVLLSWDWLAIGFKDNVGFENGALFRKPRPTNEIRTH